MGAIDEKAFEAANTAYLTGYKVRHRDRLQAAILAYEAAKAAPAEGAENATDLVSRAEVLRVIRTLGEQDADLALYGAADNARAREYGEAAATRACCAIALMPTPAPADTRPAGCRFRLQDEGKPYPRSSCAVCGRGVLTGLGTHCAAILPTPLPVTRERVGIKQLEWSEILTHGGRCLAASFHGHSWRISLRAFSRPDLLEAEKRRAQAEFEAMIVSAFARLDDGDGSLTHPTGERITRRDLNNAHRMGVEQGRLAAEIIGKLYATDPAECAEPDEADDGSLCPTEEAVGRQRR